MSRILTSTKQLREQLEGRNLYGPLNPYQLSNSDIVNTVNTIAGIIKPFSTFDLSNTVIGKATDPNSPLAKSSLEHLSSQLLATTASNANREYLPVITISNLFNPNEKFFSLKKDYQITRRATQTKIGRLLEDISGTNFEKSPFTKDSTNADYVKNTGKGQLQQLYVNLGRNLYRPSDNQFVNATKAEGFSIVDTKNVTQNLTYFTGQDENFYPFNQYKISLFSDYFANKALKDSQEARNVTDKRKSLEYGATQEFIDDLGSTKKKIFDGGDGGSKIVFNEDGLNEDVRQQLVWGRDGITKGAAAEIDGFDAWEKDGDTLNSTSNPRYDIENRFDNFKINNGILNYTKELLNTQGKYSMIDQTRKKYLDKDGGLHFRGSPLQHRVNGGFNTSRQHNTIDPYDRYAKAIRFNGNKIYGGSDDSVIHETVIPKIHPILNNQGKIDNRNMFFSIENLASKVIVDRPNSIARLEDDFGTEIPLCEAGPNEGRIMWFPPYDIRLQEQAIARHEATTFLGRSEPIYTYMNSERVATLNFKLIIDYPPQVLGRGQEEAARFFAFGDEGYRTKQTVNLSNKEEKLKENEKELAELDNKIKQADPKINFPPTLQFYFPNDVPKSGDEATAIETWLAAGYEDNIINTPEVPDGKDFRLNTTFAATTIQNITQYLHEDYFDLAEIIIIGEATQLYNGAGIGNNPIPTVYNHLLGYRRGDALKEYIKKKYKEIYPSKPDIPDYKFKIFSRGQQYAPASTASASAIPDLESKLYRNASYTIRRNETTLDAPKQLTVEEIKRKTDLINENISLNKGILEAKRATTIDQTCIFTPHIIEDGLIKGFSPFTKRKFKPAFHSQTPEDFHRRLTFLQQCTRQGPAIRKVKESGDGTFSANNAVFGRQPIQILRLGDFFNTKIVIDNISFDYSDAPWDLNPEGMGAQFMIADITIQMRVIGGQSLRGPIDALQNAVSFNYYANSTFYDTGIYAKAKAVETLQYSSDDVTKGIIQNLFIGNPEGDNSKTQAIDKNSKLKEEV